MKRCTKCGQSKPLADFGKHKQGRDGLRPSCKSCRREEGRAWREANPEYLREYYQTNKEHLNNSAREYYQINKKRMRAAMQRYYQANKEQMLEYYHAYYQENKAEYSKKQRIWNHANPQAKKAHQAIKNALKSGDLIRPDICQQCAAPGSVEAHHHSYESHHWLDVVWLCRSCHRSVHAQKAQGV